MGYNLWFFIWVIKEDVFITYMQITFKTNIFIIMQEESEIILDDPYFLILYYWTNMRFAKTVPLFLLYTGWHYKSNAAPSRLSVIYYLLHYCSTISPLPFSFQELFFYTIVTISPNVHDNWCFSNTLIQRISGAWIINYTYLVPYKSLFF